MCSSVSGPVLLSLSLTHTKHGDGLCYKLQQDSLLIIAERRVLVLGPPTAIRLSFGEECKPEGFMSAAGMFHKLRHKLVRLCWLCEDDMPHSSFSGCVNTLGKKTTFYVAYEKISNFSASEENCCICLQESWKADNRVTTCKAQSSTLPGSILLTTLPVLNSSHLVWSNTENKFVFELTLCYSTIQVCS